MFLHETFETLASGPIATCPCPGHLSTFLLLVVSHQTRELRESSVSRAPAVLGKEGVLLRYLLVTPVILLAYSTQDIPLRPLAGPEGL